MDWQQIAALALVALAALWLLRTQVLRRDKTGCGTCSGCPAPSPSPPSLISADELPVLGDKASSKPGIGTADERRWDR